MGLVDKANARVVSLSAGAVNAPIWIDAKLFDEPKSDAKTGEGA